MAKNILSKQVVTAPIIATFILRYDQHTTIDNTSRHVLRNYS